MLCACLQYTLTAEGIDYLREYLHLPAEVRSPPPASRSPLCSPADLLRPIPSRRAKQIVPATHKKQVRAPRPGQAPRAEGGAYRAPRGGDAEGYRRRADGGDKEGAGDFRPRFA